MAAADAMADGFGLDSAHGAPKRKRDLVEEIPDSTGSLASSVPTWSFSFEVSSPVSVLRSSSYHDKNAQQLLVPSLSVPATRVAFDRASPRGVRFTERFGNLSINRNAGDLSSLDTLSSPQSVHYSSANSASDITLPEPNKKPRLSAETHPPTEQQIGYMAVDGDIYEILRSENRSQCSRLDGRVSKSRSPKKRRGGSGDDESPSIFDPVRASLTWQEHEITVYDPDDEDDDGTGVNGVGFKPTAAVACARRAKRRQQLVEYRRREEEEARAKRRERRRRETPADINLEPKSPSRRVRFVEPSGGAPVEAQ